MPTQSQSPAETLRGAVAVAGPVVDLAEAALACAALDRGGLDLAPYRRHLAELIGDMRARTEAVPPVGLASVLAQWHGYRGDRETYDDIANADLAHVIDRRKGLPVALSILWMHVARGCGWRCMGLNTPGHFVIRLDAQGGNWILDPFDGGTILDHQALQMLIGRGEKLSPENVATVDDRAVLLRLQNNIKLRLQRDGQTHRALAVVERMLIIAPRAAELWREAGAINAELENLRAAIDCLDTAIALAASADARQRIAADRARLTGRLN